MSFRRALDRLFMGIALAGGIAGTAQACVLPPPHQPRTTGLKADHVVLELACFRPQRIQRGDEARARSRDSIQADRRVRLDPRFMGAR